MKQLIRIWLLSLTLGVPGCSEPGHYPITGADCGPNDPVQEMSAANCTV